MPINTREHIGVKVEDLSDDTTVAPAGTNTQTLTPPEGQCYQLLDWHYQALDPAGSAAGDHKLEVYNKGLTTDISEIAQLISDFGSPISVNGDGAFNATAESPSGAAQQFGCIYGSWWATHDQPIQFKYTNGTDVNQALNRPLVCIVRVWNNAF